MDSSQVYLIKDKPIVISVIENDKRIIKLVSGKNVVKPTSDVVKKQGVNVNYDPTGYEELIIELNAKKEGCKRNQFQVQISGKTLERVTEHFGAKGFLTVLIEDITVQNFERVVAGGGFSVFCKDLKLVPQSSNRGTFVYKGTASVDVEAYNYWINKSYFFNGNLTVSVNNMSSCL